MSSIAVRSERTMTREKKNKKNPSCLARRKSQWPWWDISIELRAGESAVKGREDGDSECGHSVEDFGSKRNRKVWKLARTELHPAWFCEFASCPYSNPASSGHLSTSPAAVSSAYFSIPSIFSTAEDRCGFLWWALNTEQAHSKCSVSVGYCYYFY